MAYDVYFSFRQNAQGVQGLSNIQKCNITLRMLAYVMVANTIDKDYKLDESTTMEAIHHFNIGI